ncbi:hypothetical protein [Cellulomonas fimi]|uniref:Secreted protein n=1 Tax=Cellulomonas fimi (strain ATCC 484 / DSM 20113 / JCM 1341 / CCUG 24087 / LMG 16345 / NBRC 15513 / NCIMB 8980 / NCTC 7547 / NRS-133) TaxID=590998 RepID=F4H0C0_CELFA|nr:hypothetical protein [Cellulomonas fimi]AEE46167.1 hypothetical protein Celf_2037 [Cellulomonas fimi ATCC 484]NNH07046.1 hypothetical protein [Cellulomonas fimi]VEH31902.1 Uncharacterised protein [Cellulomonas fimi]
MSWSEVAVLVTLVVALGVWWLWVTASRLDRLHRKVAASRSVVEAQLLRRASVAAGLATSGQLDPVSSVLVAEAAWASLSAGAAAADVASLPAGVRELLSAEEAAVATDVDERGRVESELSATLREALGDPEDVAALRADPTGDELLGSLGSAWYRVQLARRFHNEAVAQTQRARRGRLVRLLRLAGHAPAPRTLELDDEWPAALGRPGARASDDAARPGPSARGTDAAGDARRDG